MTTTPEPSTEVDIQGTMVGFVRRDIRQISDAERKHVEDLVTAQQRDAGPGRAVTRIVIETDYPDPDRLAYVASYRVSMTGEEPHVAEGECDHRGDQG